jgi:hypothetical protein
MARDKLINTADRYRHALETERLALEHMLEVAPEARAQARHNYQAAVQERERIGQQLLDAGKELPSGHVPLG